MARELEIVCPAGEPIGQVRGVGGPGCRCRIAQETVSAYRDPDSYGRFCAGDPLAKFRGEATGPEACPTWQADRAAERAGLGRTLRREVEKTAPR